MIRHAIVAFSLLIVPLDLNAQSQRDIHWPSFRGAQARGIAEGYATSLFALSRFTLTMPSGELLK